MQGVLAAIAVLAAFLIIAVVIKGRDDTRSYRMRIQKHVRDTDGKDAGQFAKQELADQPGYEQEHILHCTPLERSLLDDLQALSASTSVAQVNDLFFSASVTLVEIAGQKRGELTRRHLKPDPGG